MRRTRGTLLAVLVMSTFLAVTAQERHRGPTSCSRDPVPSDGVLAGSIADYGFHTDYGGVWGSKNDKKNGNANISESVTVWASVLTTSVFPEPQSDSDPLRSGEA